MRYVEEEDVSTPSNDKDDHRVRTHDSFDKKDAPNRDEKGSPDVDVEVGNERELKKKEEAGNMRHVWRAKCIMGKGKYQMGHMWWRELYVIADYHLWWRKKKQTQISVLIKARWFNEDERHILQWKCHEREVQIQRCQSRLLAACRYGRYIYDNVEKKRVRLDKPLACYMTRYYAQRQRAKVSQILTLDEGWESRSGTKNIKVVWSCDKKRCIWQTERQC